MNIHIIIPPYVVRGGKALIPHKAMLPVGPLVMATLLREKGCRVKVSDLVFRREWQKYLPSGQPDVVLVSCHTPRNILSCIAVLDELQKRWVGKKPHLVLGGNCCTELGTQDFAGFGLHVDSVIQGFAHSPDVIEAILNKVRGNIKTAGTLSDLIAPDLIFLPKRTRKQYMAHSQGRYPLYGHGLGCRYYALCGAEYCAATLGQPWSPRSFEQIEVEIKQARIHGYKEIWCVDNLLFVDPAHTLRFDGLVAEQDMRWSGMARPEIVARHPLSYFQKFCALAEVAMGVEAAEASSLKVLNRGVTTHYAEDCLEAFRLVNGANVDTNAFVMLDFPGYTEREFWKLYHFLVTLKTSMVSWSFYNPSVKDAVRGLYQLNQYGFYNEPFGLSRVAKSRVIQHAIALSGVWWREWVLDESAPFFESDADIGGNFLEGQILQDRTARDPLGDLWEVWLEKERRKAV